MPSTQSYPCDFTLLPSRHWGTWLFLSIQKKQTASEALESQLHLSPAKKNTYAQVMAEESKNKNKTQLVTKGHKWKIKLLLFIEKLLHEDKNMNLYWLSVGGIQGKPHTTQD